MGRTLPASRSQAYIRVKAQESLKYRNRIPQGEKTEVHWEVSSTGGNAKIQVCGENVKMCDRCVWVSPVLGVRL